MNALPRSVATCLLALSGLVAFAEAEALACSPMMEPEGYATTLVTQSVVYDDPASAEVCTNDDSGCGPRTRYVGVLRGLHVVPTLANEPSEGHEDSYVTRGSSGVEYRLKDAAGAIVAEATGSANGVMFDRLGATVCVATRRVDADAGTPTDVVAEVCAPVTVTSLEVTKQDRDDHASGVRATCGQADGGTGDGGATDGDGAAATSDGCSVQGATSTSSAPMLWAVGLVLGAGLVRRRTAETEGGDGEVESAED
ncbi:MAG: hypothetical protein EOP08_09125, partial [Proteobacteria bacterium]